MTLVTGTDRGASDKVYTRDSRELGENKISLFANIMDEYPSNLAR
jgi:hypothetical protein